MNNNKRIIANVGRSVKTLLFVAVMAMASSCDDFLTIFPTDRIVFEDFWKSKEDVESMVAESYRLMSSGDVINRIIVWGEARADNVIEGEYGGNKDIEYIMTANILPSNQYASWAPFYRVINNCNQVLKYAPLVLDEDPDFTQGDCNVITGEMYALRALCHFYLVRTFRNIPLLMEAKVDDSQELYQKQVSPIVALDACLEDLMRAEDLVLETGGYTIVSNGNNKNIGRITKDAVRAMIADVYLWKGAFLEYEANGDDNAGMDCYNNCITYCDKVLTARMSYAKKYMEEEKIRDVILHKDYPLVYMPTNSRIYYTGEHLRFPFLPYIMSFGGGAYGCNNPIEGIFELQHSTDKDNGNREVPMFYGYPSDNEKLDEPKYALFSVPSHLTQSLYGKFDYRKVHYIYESQSEDDALDKVAVIKFYNEVVGGVGNNSFGDKLKYQFFKTNDDGGRYLSESQVNWNVYRISDVMLMKAEALALVGNSVEAENILCAIYNRSQLVYQGTDGQIVGPFTEERVKYASEMFTGSITDVLDERQRELAFEAKRWYDIVRVALRDASVEENAVFQEMIENKYESEGNTSQYKARMSTVDHLFFPIAEREINIHSGLEQNKAYETTDAVQKN